MYIYAQKYKYYAILQQLFKIAKFYESYSLLSRQQLTLNP